MTGVSVCAWCVCAYEGALRSTDLSNYLDSLAAASSCDVVSALGLLLLPFGLSRTVSSDVPSSPSDCMLACSKGADHGHRSPTDDATTNRRCVHAQLTHRPPPGTTWHTRRWRQYGVGTAGRSASWIGCRTCFSRFLRHRGPDDISRGWPGHGESSCTFPVARRLHLFKRTRAVRRAIWEREPGEGAWICSSTQDPGREGGGGGAESVGRRADR